MVKRCAAFLLLDEIVNSVFLQGPAYKQLISRPCEPRLGIGQSAASEDFLNTWYPIAHTRPALLSSAEQ